MKKRIALFALVIALLSLCALSAAEESGAALWPAYDEISGLWGYIDETGAWAIAPQFPQAYDFWGGCAIVGMGEEQYSDPPQEGIIDTAGRFLLEPEYYVFDESGDTFTVMGFDEADEAIMGWYYSPTDFFTGLHWYECTAWSDGPYVKVDGGEPDRLSGLADRETGEIVLPLEYTLTGLYDQLVEDGFVIAERADTGACELIELGAGRVELPEGAVIDYWPAINGGMFPFEQDGQWGYLNTAGEIVIPAQYRYADGFWGDYANVGTWDAEDTTAIIDRAGKVVMTIAGEDWYVGYAGMAGDVLRINWCEHEWGLVTPEGVELCRFSEPEAYAVTLYAPTEDGPIWVSESLADGEYAWHLLSRKDWTLRTPGWKDYWVEGAPAAWHPVETAPGVWSYVDAYGEPVIAGVEAVCAWTFHGELARVTFDEYTEGYINRAGETVVRWTLPEE